ncbi:HAD family hydrolase [Flavobacterium sp. UBA6195]|jgi:putative hydrolase of the HAD superfamily|uniref:HAD family hydrolase n=1 Tax=Flavobacterium sp. UBA6195 TaxID=1946554 RepID=UPI0025BEFF81|nr:HAD family phosphatase [Flavobacterium sp. UBA6195]MBV2195105.1 HAD family phosphatase [Flavobacterium sp.]
MIEAIIFDFGDVFINLNKQAIDTEFRKLGLTAWHDDLDALNKKYETGMISEIEFLEGFQKHLPNASVEEIKEAWNSILGDFPLYRLEFLQMIASKYKLFLLSNTDHTHIEKFELQEGETFARDFYSCFEKVYFSYEIGIRKPDENAFKYVINNHNLNPKKTFFIDDKKENTEVAAKLGLQVWNIQPGIEDVTQLFDKKII